MTTKLNSRREKVVQLYRQAQQDKQHHKTAQARYILSMITAREMELQKLQNNFLTSLKN